MRSLQAGRLQSLGLFWNCCATLQASGCSRRRVAHGDLAMFSIGSHCCSSFQGRLSGWSRSDQHPQTILEGSREDIVATEGFPRRVSRGTKSYQKPPYPLGVDRITVVALLLLVFPNNRPSVQRTNAANPPVTHPVFLEVPKSPNGQTLYNEKGEAVARCGKEGRDISCLQHGARCDPG